VFEFVVAEVLQGCGYEIELTAQTRDGGVDLTAIRKDVLGITTRYVVECKRYAKARKVTVELVRALYGAKEAHRADQAIFVTSSRFTPDSWKLCSTGQLRNMTLVDFEKLQEWFAVYLKTAAARSR
jgi:restriction endonuclease Mrr